MSEEKADRIFTAFCNPNRLTILQLLQYGERCAREVLKQMPVKQPTLSHHMKILCDANIVQKRTVGKMTFSMLCEEGIDAAKRHLATYPLYTKVKGYTPSQYAK